MTNSGDQPLWLRVDASGYPQSAPLPASNVLQIERHILGTDGKSKSLDSLRSGDLVLVWLQVKASNSVPDALVVDLLPAGLELENQNLVYLARAVTPGTYQVPQPMVESMYVPQWRATGAADDLLIVRP